MTEMWWRSYLHRWKLLDLDLQRDLGVSRSPRSQEGRIHGALGGNQEKVCSLAAWALSWERGVLGSLYIKEALDKNKNKLKHELQIARTPGLSEHTFSQGNKFLLKCAPTSSMNRILFLQPSFQEKGPWDNLRPSAQRQEMWLWIPSGYSENWIKASCHVILYLLGP